LPLTKRCSRPLCSSQDAAEPTSQGPRLPARGWFGGCSWSSQIRSRGPSDRKIRSLRTQQCAWADRPLLARSPLTWREDGRLVGRPTGQCSTLSSQPEADALV